MFKEMCQSVLVVLLEDGAYVLDDVVAGPACGFRIVTDVVGESVFQFTDPVIRINRNGFVSIALCKR